MSSQAPIVLGTRSSPLALAQAREAKRRLLAAHEDLSADDIEIRPFVTTGDRIADRKLQDIGGKGLFTLEIEAALTAGDIDCAVHSMKDMPTALPDGLAIVCFLEREDPRDALLSTSVDSIAALRPGATVGTASLRRAAQILHRRPDLKIVNFRGNVQTRLRKLAEGQADATFLAAAGLNRLGLAFEAKALLDADEMMPAPAQGAIGVECRADDARMRALLAPLNHAPTEIALAAERALLAALDGSCRTPIAALATLGEGAIAFRARLIAPDGSALYEAARRGPPSEAERLGEDAADELRRRAGPGFFEALP